MEGESPRRAGRGGRADFSDGILSHFRGGAVAGGDSSLVDPYYPDCMPPVLTKAHGKLDRLVEKAYGKSFGSDAERVAFLFERYRELVGG